MEEKELIQKSAQGDSHAFEKLIAPYQQGIVNHMYMMFSNREDAMDMTQEALIKAFVGIKSFNGQSSFKTWLYKIATNVCLDEIRRRKRRVNVVSLFKSGEEEEYEIEPADNIHNPENIVQGKEMQRTLINAMDGLSEQLRTAIVMREILGMDYGEIAKVLGISLGTVKSRISRARFKLREKLLKHEELL